MMNPRFSNSSRNSCISDSISPGSLELYRLHKVLVAASVSSESPITRFQISTAVPAKAWLTLLSFNNKISLSIRRQAVFFAGLYHFGFMLSHLQRIPRQVGRLQNDISFPTVDGAETKEIIKAGMISRDADLAILES